MELDSNSDARRWLTVVLYAFAVWELILGAREAAQAIFGAIAVAGGFGSPTVPASYGLYTLTNVTVGLILLRRTPQFAARLLPLDGSEDAGSPRAEA
jgi:hypothetical protein